MSRNRCTGIFYSLAMEEGFYGDACNDLVFIYEVKHLKAA